MEQALLSPYVMLAAATVGKVISKKAVDTLARSSLNGISTALNQRFQGDSEVQALKSELELKTKVLLMPVDACVRHALHGNTVLQGAVEVVMEALRQIAAFEEAVQAQEMAAARGDRSGSASAMTAGQACARLQKLITQLDTLVPFFTMAIASSGLAGAKAGQSTLSPGRLIFASCALTAAAVCGASACVFQVHKARLCKDMASRAQSGMRVVYPLCCLRVMTSGDADSHAVARASGNSAAAGAAANGSTSDASAELPNGGNTRMHSYVLQIEQRLDDGLYHDTDESPGSMSLLIADIAGLEFTTAHSLGLDSDPFSPALAVQMNASSAVAAMTGATPRVSGNRVSAAGQQQQQQLYVIRCLSDVPDDTESESGDSNSDQASNKDDALSDSGPASGSERSSAAGSVTHCKSAIEDAAAAKPGNGDDGTPQQALGRLDYVLRLCRLEAAEGVPHTAIAEDDRLQEALAQDLVLQGGVSSPAADGSAAQSGSRRSATPPLRPRVSSGASVSSAIRDLSKLGFESGR